MSLPASVLCVATAFSATSVMAQQCETGFSIDKIVFDMNEYQAYMVMDNGVNEPIKIWTKVGDHVDRLAPAYLDFPMKIQKRLQSLLDEMTFYGRNNLEGVDYAGNLNQPRATIHSVEVMRSVFNNKGGAKITYPMTINLNREEGNPEPIEYNGGYTSTPEDFFLESYDLDALDMYLENMSSIWNDARNLNIPSRSICL